MSKIDQGLTFPAEYDAGVLTSAFRALAYQVNAVSKGQMAGTFNASTAIPSGTATNYAVGDFVRKKTPVEAGGAGNKYVIIGWVCTVAGAPGTFLECRVLTGN